MWTPKGKRKIYPFPVPPLYPTLGYRNRAVEWNDSIFFNNNSPYTGANLAKVDTLTLPEEPSITLISPDISYPVPNESGFNWTLTNISDDTFVLSGYFGKGFTRVSISGEIVADADLLIDNLAGISPYHQYMYFATIAQYHFNGTIIASSSYANTARCITYPVDNPQTNDVTPVSGLSNAFITHIYGLNDEIYLGNQVNWDTIILNPDFSVNRTISGSCYTIAEELDSSYYITNPLNMGGTIYDEVIGDATISRRVYGSDTEVATKTITDSYIMAVADPYPTIPFLSILYCDGFPMVSSSRKVVQVDKETLDTLHVWDIPDSVGIDVRHGCIDSLGYTYFPIVDKAVTGIGADENILRVPPPPDVPAIPYMILLHYNAHPFTNSGTLPTSQTAPSTRFTTSPAQIIYGTGSLLGSLGNGTSDPNPLTLTTTNTLLILESWTVRTKFILNAPSGIYTGLISFWAGSGIGSVSINSAGSIIVMQFSSAISCPITVGSVQELSIELFVGVLYIYIDGTLVGSQPYNDPLSGLPITGTTIGAGGTIFTIGDAGNALLAGQQTIMDEFIFVNGTALAGGASSYSVQVSPYLP